MTPWLQTRSGARYDLLNPDPASIVLADAAHAIAHLGRFTGHARELYTVAQHCVTGTRILAHEGHSSGVQAAFLVHDLHEAVTGDVASPIKRAIAHIFRDTLDRESDDYADLERAYPGNPWDVFERLHADAFARRFCTPRTPPAAVKSMDLRMLATEARDLLGPAPEPWQLGPDFVPIEGLRITRCWSPAEAKGYYLDECVRLGVR